MNKELSLDIDICSFLLFVVFHLEDNKEVQNEEMRRLMMITFYKGLHNLAAKQEIT